MRSNTPASMPLRILQASRTSSNDDGDLNKMISISTEDSRSNPLARCMLRQPDSDTDHKQYAHLHCLTALEDDNFRVFIAQDTAPHSLGSLLASVWIEDRRITDPLPVLELPPFINENVYRYVHGQANAQRMAKVKRDYSSIFILAAKPTHPKHSQIRKTLAAFAVAEIRKTEPESDIVAQETTDFEDSNQVFPAAEGWEKVNGVVVLDSPMLHTLEPKQRSLRMFVNWGRKKVF